MIGKPVYIGGGVWETVNPDGSLYWEIAVTPSELAKLEAAAAIAGVTVERLVKNRISRRPDSDQRSFDN